MDSRCRHAERGKWILALGALACALVALTARAEVCPALFQSVTVPKEIEAFLDNDRIEKRVIAYAGDEDFQSFYGEVSDWLTLEKKTGRKPTGKARLRVPGGDPLLGVLKRDKYTLSAALTVEKPGEVRMNFEIAAARVTSPVAILDLQTLQLTTANKLFADFAQPGEELRQLTIHWDLGRDAPRGFADHLRSLKFEQTKKIPSCSRFTRGILALVAGAGGAFGGSAFAIYADTEFGDGQDTSTNSPFGAVLGGIAAAVPTAIYVCKRPSTRAGEFEIVFKRVAAPAT